MREYEKKDFSKLLKKGALEGRRWMRQSDSEAVRIYDRNLESVPVTVELYGRWARVVDYSPEGLDGRTREEVIDLVSRMVYVEKDMIIWQYRKKREGLEQHSLVSDQKVEVEVKEHGLVFRVDLTSHIDTGLFLDHALTREYVRSISAGMRVLNLFSYTGSFSVYAASGGAESVTSVDMANTYCAIARENLKANGFLDEERYPVVASDALAFIDEAVKRKDVYDIVIFDPPSFSNSHRMEHPFDVKKDYLKCIGKLSRIMSDHALLIFSTNSSTFALDKGSLKRSFRIAEMTQELSPVGFVRSRGGASRVWVLERLSVFDGKASGWKRDIRYIRDRKVKAVRDEDFDILAQSFQEAGEREKAEFKREERREYSRKPSFDRPQRRYEDDERPRRRYDDEERSRRRYEDDDRPRRRYDDEERPRRRYEDDDRPRRSYDRPRNQGYGRQTRGDDERSHSPRRDSYFRDDDRREREGRPYRHSDDDRRPSYSRAQSHSYDKARRERKPVRPYGYDNIRKSRDRRETSSDEE